KNNHIQQLINSRKLSTNEEYELFEGALQALHMSISIDDIADICKSFFAMIQKMMKLCLELFI
ncbi:hypothetical protein DWX81_17850, partial [Roseburia inulinivorans]|uniref:Imm30 family immunity protein n=1 Tax=Roseburia inulinivorans TaxID=360807 RepID=UPI000FEEFE63